MTMPTSSSMLLISLAFAAIIGTFDVSASEGETYILSRPLTRDADVGSNFVISEDGNQTFYLSTSTFMGQRSIAAVRTLGGSVDSPTGGSGHIDFKHIRDLEFIVVSQFEMPTTRYQVNWIRRTPNGRGSVNLNFGVADNSAPITQFTLSPSKEYLVFVQGGQLYSSRIVLGDFGLMHLSEIPGVTGEVADFKFAPDGRIFFRVDEPDGQYELYSIMPNGEGVRYHDGGFIPAIAANTSVLTYDVTPDNRYVVYRLRDFNVVQLKTVNLHSGAFEIRILDGIGSVSSNREVTTFKVSPNSEYVVYRADKNSLGVFELFVRPVDGSSEGGKLNPSPFPNTADIFDFAISPDSSRVVYIADQDSDNIRELYSTSIVRSGLPFIFVFKLNPSYSGSQDVATFTIGGNSQHVYFRANQDNVGRNEVYRVPINAGASRRLNHPLNAGQNVGLFKISNDNARLVYTVLKSGPDLLYSVESGGGEASLLTRRTENGGVDTGQLGVVDFALSPDNETVVYTAGPPGQRQLFAHSFKRGGELCMPIVARNSKIVVICL